MRLSKNTRSYLVWILLFPAVVGPVAHGAAGRSGASGVDQNVEHNESVTDANEWLPGGESELDIPWRRISYGFGIVLAVLCVGIYLLKRVSGVSPGGGSYMEILEAKPLTGKLKLFLVKIGPRVVLLAARGEAIEKIGEFAEEDMPFPEDTDMREKGRFSRVMTDILGAGE